MILRHLSVLRSNVRLVLASGSPRRLEILRQCGLEPVVTVSTFAEDLDKALHTPAQYVVATATAKAREVFAKVAMEEGGSPVVVIGADTVVEIDGDVLEKPSSPEHAIEMISRLSGRQHSVWTGVVVMVGSHGCADPVHVRDFACETRVTFAPLQREEIEAYVATGEPFDKAGGYGIQAAAGCFVSAVDGCYYNVMGLPLHRVTATLGSLIDDGVLSVASPTKA